MPCTFEVVNGKVSCRLTFSAKFRANARVIRIEAIVGQVGPIASDFPIEMRRALSVLIFKIVVELVLPSHIRSELGLASHVQRQVNTETGSFRHGVDEMTERRAPRQCKIVTFRKMQLRYFVRGKPTSFIVKSPYETRAMKSGRNY